MISTVHEVLEDYWGNSLYTLDILAGDASNRKYYRSGIDSDSIVVMLCNESFSSHSDAFVQMTRYLLEMKIPVPEIIADYSEQGILIIEDLGDVTLQDAFIGNQDHTLHVLYPEVFNVLLKMHIECTRTMNESFAGKHNRRFDFGKLRWELDFFLDHYVRGHKKIRLTRKQDQILSKVFNDICIELDVQEPVFTHRDFHSRNLMVRESGVYVIDHQDARSGPAEYDLASLLRDAYVVLPERFIESFLDEYYRERGDKRSCEQRRFIFSLMCLQRNIKALGTFGFQAERNCNPLYLKYVPTLMQHINRELEFPGGYSAVKSGIMKSFGIVLNDLVL